MPSAAMYKLLTCVAEAGVSISRIIRELLLRVTMNDPRTQTWSSLYNQAIARINTSDEESEFSGVPLVMTVTTR